MTFFKTFRIDCIVAAPLIDQALGEIDGGFILLTVDVIREEFRSPEYRFRVHPTIKLKCVPTLMKWQGSRPIGSLNDSQCQNIELIRELVIV